MSHHCLIRAIVEREVNRQGLGTWEDFLRRSPIEPNRGGPQREGAGTREKMAIGVKKVIYKNVQEALASAFTPRVARKRTFTPGASSSKRRKLPTKHTEENLEETPLVSQETPPTAKGKEKQTTPNFSVR